MKSGFIQHFIFLFNAALWSAIPGCRRASSVDKVIEKPCYIKRAFLAARHLQVFVYRSANENLNNEIAEQDIPNDADQGQLEDYLSPCVQSFFIFNNAASVVL